MAVIGIISHYKLVAICVFNWQPNVVNKNLFKDVDTFTAIKLINEICKAINADITQITTVDKAIIFSGCYIGFRRAFDGLPYFGNLTSTNTSTATTTTDINNIRNIFDMLKLFKVNEFNLINVIIIVI